MSTPTTPTTPIDPGPATPAAVPPAYAQTPPPMPPAPAGPPPGGQPAGGGSTSRVIAILTIALGGAIVLGAIGSAVLSTVAAASVRTETQTADVDGVTSLDIDVDAATMRVEFADVSEATLEVTSGGGVGAWKLDSDGETLSVATPNRIGPWWLFGGEIRATLTLPTELQDEALDASLDLSAGELSVEGDFADLGIDIGAGTVRVDGSARSLDLDLSAGGADIDLAGVDTADITVNAGAADARLTGAAPSAVTVDVNAGSLDLRLPDGAYDVRSDVAAGDFENQLTTDADADAVVDVTVSAGSVTIRSAR